MHDAEVYVHPAHRYPQLNHQLYRQSEDEAMEFTEESREEDESREDEREVEVHAGMLSLTASAVVLWLCNEQPTSDTTNNSLH